MWMFDWDGEGAPNAPGASARPLEINDETLRDGLQAASVIDPSLDDKRELLDLMARIGVRAASLGMPAAGSRALEEVVALARHLREARLGIEPNCGARTLVKDIEPVVEAAQRSGQPIVVHAFIGSSPIRMWAEGWDPVLVRERAVRAIDFAVREGLPVALVTEDTSRTPPEVLQPLFRAAIDHGASRLVLCDTAGHAIPAGVRALLRWTRRLLHGTSVTIEWHGHDDRGLALTNALAAAEAGADRIHACGLGIGERVGNTPTELLLLNAKMLGWIDRDLEALGAYVRKIVHACGVTVPANCPKAVADLLMP